MFKVEIGQKLRPKPHIRDWEDEAAEVISYNAEKKTFNIWLGGNWSANLTEEQINKDFDLYVPTSGKEPPIQILNPACVNELEAAIANMPPTYERLKGDSEWNTPHWVFLKHITGNFAKCAVRQSPYAFPENLEKMIGFLDACLQDRIKDWPKDKKHGKHRYIMALLSLCEINKWLHDILDDMPHFKAWNLCKNEKARCEIQFTTVDTTHAPDDDFIDLEALLHGVCLELRDEQWLFEMRLEKKIKEE